MKTVLVIEDNTLIRENTAEMLELEGYNVVTALNGRQALEILQAKVPDLILCDIIMPELNGFELLERLRQNNLYKHIPFVFITGSAEKKEIEEGLQMGAQAYLCKPYESDDLLETIKRNLNPLPHMASRHSD